MDKTDEAMQAELGAALATDAAEWRRPRCTTSHPPEKVSHYVVRRTVEDGRRIPGPAVERAGHDVAVIPASKVHAVSISAERAQDFRAVNRETGDVVSWADIDTVFLCGCRF